MAMNQGDTVERAQEDLLVIEAQGGNQRAFEALFRIHNAPLRRFAFRVCGDEQLALDAVQDAWITLSKTLRRLKDPRGFRVWAYKTVRWRVTDQARRQKMDNVLIHEDVESIPQASEFATRDQLGRHLDQLPEKEKNALVLFYLDGLQIQEIAAIEQVPVGTVKSRLSRARDRMRETMAGEMV